MTLSILFFCILSYLPFGFTGKKTAQYERFIAQHHHTFPGWCSKEKALAMMELIDKLEPLTCVEIGVFGGASLLPTAYALELNHKGIVFAVDPWNNDECVKYITPQSPDYSWWKQVNLKEVYSKFASKAKSLNLLHRCLILKETTTIAFSRIGTIDLLHIDGNHDEQSVINDVSLFFPKVRKSGYIWINAVKRQSTEKGYQELFKNCKIIQSVDNGNCLLLQKL